MFVLILDITGDDDDDFTILVTCDHGTCKVLETLFYFEKQIYVYQNSIISNV